MLHTSCLLFFCLSPTTPAAVFGWMYNSSYDCGRGGKAALARQKFARGIMPRFDANDEARGCRIHVGGFSTFSPIAPPYKPMREGPSSSGLFVLPREVRSSELVPLLVIFLLSFAPLPLHESQKLYLHCIPINHAAAPYSNFKFHKSHFHMWMMVMC